MGEGRQHTTTAVASVDVSLLFSLSVNPNFDKIKGPFSTKSTILHASMIASLHTFLLETALVRTTCTRTYRTCGSKNEWGIHSLFLLPSSFSCQGFIEVQFQFHTIASSFKGDRGREGGKD